MINKITIFYTDNTYVDVDSGYFGQKADPEIVYKDSSKTIKEIFIYYSDGKYTKFASETKIVGGGPAYANPTPRPFEPSYPSGPWSNPAKIID